MEPIAKKQKHNESRYIIVGRRGCGKTTFAIKLANKNPTCVIYDQNSQPEKDSLSWIYICQKLPNKKSFLMQSCTNIFTYVPKTKFLFQRKKNIKH